jgi:hypothetical protein
MITVSDINFNEQTTDIDSHADQIVVGNNSLIVQDYDKPVSVRGFDPNGPTSLSLRTVSAALVYDCPSSG